MKGLKAAGLGLAIAIVVAGSAYYWWQSRQGRLPDSIASGNGRIEAVEIDVAAKTAGRVEDILVNEGDFVESGQILARVPGRGLTFAFFILLLGWVSYHLTTPEHSFVGRYAGGLLIYAISVLDAHKLARIGWERARRGPQADGG